MNNVEERLRKKKSEIDQIQVPDEMELRLRSALERRQVPPIKKNWIPGIAILCILALLVIYQSDTLAFYGKKLIGYDPIMNGTLKQLNQLGKGQSINKSYTYKNGVVLSLDGIMLDDNQLLAYYTINNPEGKLDIGEISSILYIKGMAKDYMINSSQGLIDDNESQIRYIASFEPPYFFEKELSFVCSMEDGLKTETGSIAFNLDRNQAMGHILKKELHKSVQLDQTKVHFDTIIATPTTTVIKGTLQTSLGLARDQFLHKRFRPNDLELELIANGKKVARQEASMSTNVDGITFETKFDALPPDLKELKINLVSFSSDHDVNQQFELQLGEMKQPNQIMEQPLIFEQLYTSEGDTYMIISSEESVVLTKVYLIMDGKQVNLKETIKDEYNKKADGTIIHTRTLHFPGTGQKYQLDIQRMTYARTYNKNIVIPID